MNLRFVYGWIFVRPRRWFFHRMICNSYLQWWPERNCCGWIWPNWHWWILYQTIFKFFKWLHYDAWRPLAKWSEVSLVHRPWYSSLVKRIGETTAGYAISGMECHHCASKSGCQVSLSDDDGGGFRLLEEWTVATLDGTDYRFRGITRCPKCGYEAEFEDGSL